jgi:hypothetical protein
VRTQTPGPKSEVIAMPDAHSCHTCNLDIEMRYGISRSKSINQGYWAHLDNVEGIAADLDHDALR